MEISATKAISGQTVSDHDHGHDPSMLCVCKYPILIIDNRQGGVIHYSIPIDILSEMPIPKMSLVEEIGLDGIKREYERVEWQKPHPSLKRYNVLNREYKGYSEHIALAGCPEEELSCSMKNTFVIYHPIKEWEDWHVRTLD